MKSILRLLELPLLLAFMLLTFVYSLFQGLLIIVLTILSGIRAIFDKNYRERLNKTIEDDIKKGQL